MSNERERLQAVGRKLERMIGDVGMAQMNARGSILDRLAEPLAAIETAAQAMANALLPGATVDPARQDLQGKERQDSLITALERLARERGAALLPFDSLHSAVVDHAPAQDKVWWHSRVPGLVCGLLREEPAIREALGTRGVLVWEGQTRPWQAGDELWRIVDTHWLTAHADIRAYVAGPWSGGRRCRFCRVLEESAAHELQPLELEKIHGQPAVEGMTVPFAVGGVLVHGPCREHWLKWLAIASRYKTPREAQAADAAAGREPRAPKPQPPRLMLERPLDAPRTPS